MTATEPVHVWSDSSGSSVTTRCGLVLEIPPGHTLHDVNVTVFDAHATCSQCRHPSNHP